jgi:hypothetical protein
MTRTYLLAALATVAAAACTDSDNSLVILQNQVPGDGCVTPANPSAASLGRGLLHPGSQFGYVFTPVVQSRVTASNQVDRSVFLEGANIELSDLNGNEVTPGFSTRFAGRVTPGGTTGVAAFEITPRGLGEGDYIASVKIFGDLGGSDVWSQTYDYPIRVSAGDFSINLGSCSALPAGFVGLVEGSACNPLQDGFVECCDSGGQLVCPAQGPQ